MHVFVAGATGFIGKQIVRDLLEQGVQVTITCRDLPRARKDFPDCNWVECNFQSDGQIEDWLPHLKDVDVVVNAVGIFREDAEQNYKTIHVKTPIALFQACYHAGIKRIIQISALGADGDTGTPYHQSKRQIEEFLKTLRLPHVILRPSLVYGDGGESWEFFQSLSTLPVTPIPGDGQAPVQPIHVEDVSRAVLAAIKLPLDQSPSINLVSEEVLTFKTYLATIRRWLGLRRMRSIHIPYTISRLLARLNPLFGDGPLSPEAVVMLQKSKIYETEPCQRVLGITPANFSEQLQNKPPATRQDYFARTLFPEYLLSWSLGVLWIWTAIVSAFVYPQSESFSLLEKAGIGRGLAPYALYGAAFLDAVIGFALLFRYRLKQVCWLQIGVILAYTGILTLSSPELWAHPFGPLTKNIPILAAIIFLMTSLERNRAR